MSAEHNGVWMWSRACALLEEAERRHRRFYELLGTPSRQPVWEPPVDMFVHEGELQIVVAMPAVRAEDIAVELRNTWIFVRAESRLPMPTSRARILRLEIPYGRIERRIDLPAGSYRLLAQEFADGCLRVRLAGEVL